MTSESNIPKHRAIVEVDETEQALITTETDTEPTNAELQQETIALIEAIKRKAQAESQKVGEFSREQYLEAMRKARQEIESRNLFEPDRIAESIQIMTEEVEKNWDGLVKEVSDFGDRLNDAAQAAWEKLTEPRPR
ncbi:MAG: hypothetical protein SAJ12_22475 [Jaaginema sp. PMC 1079.18]|nr:hypothetical protein [Jaaginema sp. PMC 1080.18]MEC4853755.1 hypothetical protein [Jaaginema sp. PMC 1079.18]MEC4868719.1 hypothetical protein [Jaaginema sp. PMC 1078.18]